MNNTKDQISRMKAMMSYGLKTESKNSYKSIEHQKEGADGKMYAIIREGSKFYIKVSDKKTNVIKEDFNYIGGFRNRKDYEYNSYANALKNFDMKMISLKESCGKNNIIIESWNPDKKEELALESTDKMRREIQRQRQIMSNSSIIQEKKNYSANLNEEDSCKVDKECAKTQKDNIKREHTPKGEPTDQGGDPFVEDPKAEFKKTQKNSVKKEFRPIMHQTGATKSIRESEQVLGWNSDEDYLDTSNGTEIGDSAPFTEDPCCDREMKKDQVEEGVAMHKSKSQNTPAVGVGEVGDGKPFEEDAENDLQEGFFHNDAVADEDQLEDTPEEIQLEGEEDSEEVELDDVEDVDLEDSVEDDIEDVEFEDEVEDVDFESDLDDETEDEFNGDLETRISAMEDLLSKIAEKLGVDAFEDDDLYTDSDEVEGAEDMIDADEMADAIESDEAEDSTEEPLEDEDVEVFESKNYRKMMSEEAQEFDYFSKHPAFAKEPMTLPTTQYQEMDGYYDVNDDSINNEYEFAKEIGDGAPFELPIEKIENAIAESIKRILKKKI